MSSVACRLRRTVTSQMERSIRSMPPEIRRKRAAAIIRNHYPLVLMFHSVVPQYSGEDYTVSTSTVERIIVDLIEDGYAFAFEDEFYHCKPQSVILTFDDGFANNYTEVFPLLQKYNVKASINLIANRINDPAGLYLTKQQIMEMQESGLVQFQSHTCSHRSLDRLPLEEAQFELIESKEKLQALLRGKVNVFVYPREDFTEEIAREASKYYDLCYGWNGLMHVEQRCHLPRIEILEGNSDYAYYVLLEKRMDAYHRVIWSLRKNKPKNAYRRLLL